MQGEEERRQSLIGRRGGGKSLLRRLKGLVLSSLWITMFPRICLISASACMCMCQYWGVCVYVCVFVYEMFAVILRPPHSDPITRQ